MTEPATPVPEAHARPRRQAGRWRPLLAAGGVTIAIAAEAHVKWFAPYIVGAPPRPLTLTLTDRWFWTGLVLVLLFFLTTRALERTALGSRVLTGFDQLTDPLWQRLDDFVRMVVGGFFVAIFAVGGVYLTPDLKTSQEWISWMQLLIAAFVCTRRTMPLAAIGIVGLWALALTEYDLFHLLDYLALGVGVAVYLVLAASDRPAWRQYRFQALRWGVAIALMWSSLEKFAYPDWFYPLVEEKPFLTFGIPRDMFIPMAGVAEFTMGFGLLWTALVRRLSAITLFVIFVAAVYPFGRIDLVGHALIMAIIVVIAADPTPPTGFTARRALWGIPVMLGVALVVFAGSYWGLHRLLYGPDGAPTRGAALKATHAYSAEHPHGHGAPAAPPSSTGASAPMPPALAAARSAREANEIAMHRMHGPMQDGIEHDDPDVAFVLGMIPHHQGAIDMARIQLKYGKDPANRKLAAEIIASQEHEIQEMRRWLAARGIPAPASD